MEVLLDSPPLSYSYIKVGRDCRPERETASEPMNSFFPPSAKTRQYEGSRLVLLAMKQRIMLLLPLFAKDKLDPFILLPKCAAPSHGFHVVVHVQLSLSQESYECKVPPLPQVVRKGLPVWLF